MAPSTNDSKVWLITGCSSGFGRELSIAARKRGDFVIATARKIETLKDLQDLGCQALTLDVTADDATVNDIVAKAHDFYGRIDILVNNAAFVPVGAVEEASSEEVQAIFDTNFFGLLRVTRAVLPYMRAKRSGMIANIGSQGGYAPFVGCGIYCASKAAVALVSQTLRLETAPLGIEVTTIELGHFQTSVLSKGVIHQKVISDYDDVTKEYKEAVLLGTAPASDTVLGAQAVLEALTKTGRCVGRALPSRMPLGVIYDVLQGALTLGQQELNDWKDFTDPETFPLHAN
ncbi:hypothetical protein Poli38472_007550 [Pythium oligandrum]|uniref:Uncharacterized protein n=1 Tax=Pythium oligandrum TaxID=41045 RepID=A0A8K1CRZ3_PYTOL|nr:hypothetical protein Poli38472_007550 [Pythium oligandrum]|eukprot:TMW67878.1 hypothetical protein Poli38472_007550 [Pythium oligandrum]